MFYRVFDELVAYLQLNTNRSLSFLVMLSVMAYDVGLGTDFYKEAFLFLFPLS